MLPPTEIGRKAGRIPIGELQSFLRVESIRFLFATMLHSALSTRFDHSTIQVQVDFCFFIAYIWPALNVSDLNQSYEIRCPVHGFITLNSWEKEIISHP